MATNNKAKQAAIVISPVLLRKLRACSDGLDAFRAMLEAKKRTRLEIRSSAQFCDLAEEFTLKFGTFSHIYWLLYEIYPFSLPPLYTNEIDRRKWLRLAISRVLRHKQNEMDKRHAKRKAK